MTSLEREIIEAARHWYRSGGNAESALAEAVQEYEEELRAKGERPRQEDEAA